MTHDHASHPQSVQSGGFWRSRYALGVWAAEGKSLTT